MPKEDDSSPLQHRLFTLVGDSPLRAGRVVVGRYPDRFNPSQPGVTAVGGFLDTATRASIIASVEEYCGNWDKVREGKVGLDSIPVDSLLHGLRYSAVFQKVVRISYDYEDYIRAELGARDTAFALVKTWYSAGDRYSETRADKYRSLPAMLARLFAEAARMSNFDYDSLVRNRTSRFPVVHALAGRLHISSSGILDDLQPLIESMRDR